ncbi:unnamed protein product [Heligmosomoides polygyrus]|uniref:alpha-1,6-mannosyl-glycoprotein 6-beta-N-acetylglucosaminyltransferase n=1 Tax=Heligmosomoides polygyrus TaxID=6339 RepID=A0A3P8D716_HELPZ|nr:unnamed protein product [Heligmosomoides polygyrus]
MTLAQLKMKVIIHLGLLSESNLRIGEKSRSGGPLGELLQWSDLIACVFLLGHNLYISTEKASLIRHVDQFPVNSPCPSRRRQVDLVITDIIGLRSFKARKDFLLRNRCRIRLVDSFGTQTEFNYRSYFNAHKAALSAKGRQAFDNLILLDSLTNPWGGHGLQLLQHWTFFPHSPDNGFLGFAIHASNVKPLFERNSLGRPVSLVYGKEKYMWNGSEAVVELLKNLTEVHATVSDLNDTDHPMFSGVVNHGFLSAAEVAALLKSVNIFVGLGFPFEGPAPLEALASGAVFINPRFEPSKSRRNTPFLRDKPTLREFTSQSPYLERIGPPHVYTVDFNDISALESVIRKAVEEKPVPFIPEEFSPHGMLIRVNMLLYRDLCSSVSVWPPPNKLVPVISSPDESCEKSCESTGLVCEPSFFPLVNMAAVMSSVAGCSPAEVGNSTEPYAPFNCSHQASSLMFSCATRPPPGSGVVRLCPCRDYMPEQISFCKTCVS